MVIYRHFFRYEVVNLRAMKIDWLMLLLEKYSSRRFWLVCVSFHFGCYVSCQLSLDGIDRESTWITFQRFKSRHCRWLWQHIGLWIERSRVWLLLEAWVFFSSLSYLPINGVSLIRSLVEVQCYWFSTFQQKWRLNCAAWGKRAKKSERCTF